MSRVSQSQRQRTKNNPLLLGSFNETSLRVLTGTLGPKNQVVGRPDTNQHSNGGFGGGTYNHWFQVNITTPAWIITRNAGARPNYTQVSAYDLNYTPIQGRMIFQADTNEHSSDLDGDYYPYLGHVMGASSDLYNSFRPNSIGLGSDLYFPVEKGNYLICVSTTRNELLDYSLALIIEVQTTEMFLLLEDLDISFLAAETTLDDSNTIIIGPVFNVNYALPYNLNAFTSLIATIDANITVTIGELLANTIIELPFSLNPFIVIGPIATTSYVTPANLNVFSNESIIINPGVVITITEGNLWVIGTLPFNASWYIGELSPEASDIFIIEPSDTYDYDSLHEHSYAEWWAAWQRERSPGDALPAIFNPLITSS